MMKREVEMDIEHSSTNKDKPGIRTEATHEEADTPKNTSTQVGSSIV